MDSFVRILQTERPNAELTMLSIMPNGDPILDADINTCNDLLRSKCQEHRCGYVDLCEPFVLGNVIQPSLVHGNWTLNKAGTGIWVEKIRTALMDRLLSE